MRVKSEKTRVDKYTEKYPWSSFEQFTRNKLNVNAQSELSLQFHEYHNEFWKILSGNPIIMIADRIVQANKDDEFFLPRRAEHQIKTLISLPG